MTTYEELKRNEEVRTYIEAANESLMALGITEHSFPHVTKVAETAGKILKTLGYDDHDVELARIAAFLHDIGNLANRSEHAQSCAVMAFTILRNMDLTPRDLAVITRAIANHDESVGLPVDALSAALILADKSDVRRNRVRNPDQAKFDIHDRVNYSVTHASLEINEEKTQIRLKIEIDTN